MLSYAESLEGSDAKQRQLNLEIGIRWKSSRLERSMFGERFGK
ncbi:hypothetical protein LC55x_5326 [Lysobacter capsici]|nr:hypothetical protein LC55x_5326 [Lysobacter capsici]